MSLIEKSVLDVAVFIERLSFAPFLPEFPLSPTFQSPRHDGHGCRRVAKHVQLAKPRM